LARAYGAPAELERAMRRDPSRRVANLLRLAPAAADAAKLLGVQRTAVAAVVDAFDDHPTTEFRQLAEEWLEQNTVRGRPALTRHAVRAILRIGAKASPNRSLPGAVTRCSSAER